MPATHNIYERKSDESEKAWKAFTIFLDLGSDRGLSVVAERLSVTRQAIQKIAKKNNWFERAAAYDNDIRNALTTATLEEEINVRTQMIKNIQLLLKAQEKEIIIRLSEQDRKIANPDYDYRPSSIRTISETGKLAMEHLTLLEPPKAEMWKDNEPAIE